MNLQTRIFNINNELISLFAILDGWMDHEFESIEQNFSELIREVILYNQKTVNTLSSIFEFSSVDTKSTDSLAHRGTEILNKEESLDVLLLRDLLREQLFFLLRTLDNFHTESLNPFNGQSDDSVVLDHLEALIGDLSVKIGTFNTTMV